MASHDSYSKTFDYFNRLSIRNASIRKHRQNQINQEFTGRKQGIYTLDDTINLMKEPVTEHVYLPQISVPVSTRPNQFRSQRDFNPVKNGSHQIAHANEVIPKKYDIVFDPCMPSKTLAVKVPLATWNKTTSVPLSMGKKGNPEARMISKKNNTGEKNVTKGKAEAHQRKKKKKKKEKKKSVKRSDCYHTKYLSTKKSMRINIPDYDPPSQQTLSVVTMVSLSIDSRKKIN